MKDRKTCHHWIRAAAAAAMILALAAACNPLDDDDDDSDAATTVAGELTPERVIEMGTARWDQTETAHFALNIEGSTYLDTEEEIELSSAEGDLKRPQSAKATAQIGFGVVNLDVSLVFIGDDAYMTDFLTGNWGPAPDDFSYNPSLLFSTTEGLGPVLQQMQDPQIAGTEQIDGRETVHLIGSVTQDMIDDLTAGTVTGDRIGVDIWFDSETYDVLRLRMSEPQGDSGEPSIWNIDFSNHNQPVEIEPPAV